jgi:hypothetical protein
VPREAVLGSPAILIEEESEDEGEGGDESEGAGGELSLSEDDASREDFAGEGASAGEGESADAPRASRPAHRRSRIASVALLRVAPPPHRALLDAVACSLLPRDPVFAAATRIRASAARATPLGSPAAALLGAPGGAGAGIAADAAVLTASSDPLTITMGHTLQLAASRAILHLAISNAARGARLPAGTRVTLALSGALTFDRASVITAMIASSSARLGGGGEAGAGGGAAMGAASIGASLSGDFITFQRTAQHHAT